MPIIKSAIKRMKQATVRRARNVGTKKNLKSAVKTFLEKPSAAGLRAAQSEIDTAVKKRVLEKRTAARRKSHLVRVAKEAGLKMEASKKTKAPVKRAEVKVVAKKAAAKAPAKKTATKPAVKAAVAKKPAVKKAVVKTAVKKPAVKKK